MHFKVYKKKSVENMFLLEKKNPHFPLLFTWDDYYCSARAGFVIVTKPFMLEQKYTLALFIILTHSLFSVVNINNLLEACMQILDRITA